jgi:predicted flap endonuclease-1-like 5' DNA nuclease
MKEALLFLLMMIAAVLCGLVIAYFYLRRLADERTRVRRAPRVVPFHDKPPPVDLTPTYTVDWRPQRHGADVKPGDAEVDGAAGRHDSATAAQQGRAPAADNAGHHQRHSGGSTPAGDDLKLIRGIGPKLEQLLNANGICRYGQIAAWQEADIAAIDELLPAFHGRVRRDDWVGQARQLMGSRGAGVEATGRQRSGQEV